jgi:hypothetical protein
MKGYVNRIQNISQMDAEDKEDLENDGIIVRSRNRL